MSPSYLKIAGQLIDNAILESVEVTQALNEHWWCKVECRQTEDIRIAVEDSLGQDLQILTIDQAGAQHIVFDGIVLEATIVYEIFGSYTARFTGVTRSYKLDLTDQEAYFRKKALAAVASALAGADGLTADVKCQAKPAKNYVQWGESDFQFLKRMAYEHQAWIRPTAQGIEICDSFQATSQVSWRVEGGLFEFDMEGQLSQASFNGTHNNARTMQSTSLKKVNKDPAFTGGSDRMVSAVRSSSRWSLPSGYMHLDSRAATADEYQQVLERESIRSVGGGLVGHGVSQNDTLKAGDTVEVTGPLDANGQYGITKLIHRWTRLGYENEFWCTPWRNYFSPRTLSHRPMPGAVLARVSDHNDPRKMGRIQVQYDWQGDGQTGWARMVTPHAGADRGFMFMPEKGDEVLVGFEHGDPERPYILGSLWNGVDSAPRDVFWGGDIDPNDVKRIVTKSGHRIQLSDRQGKESIVIATPTHLKISLLEKADETNRSMILLHSNDGDVFFSAPDGRIDFHSQYLSWEVGAAGAAPPPPGAPGSPGTASATSGPPPAAVIAHKVPAGAGAVPPPAPFSSATEIATLQWRKKHEKEISQALADQETMLLQKQAELKRWNKSDQEKFRRAFGSTDEKTRKLMQDRVDRELALNKKTTIDNFKPAEKGEEDAYAYVTPDDPSKTIYIGKDFYKAPATGPNSKAGTLCHEMSHFQDIGGTDDLGYGTTEASALARKHPDKAIQNADNFEYYTEGALDPPPPAPGTKGRIP